MDDMSPIIGEFLTESYENLDQLDQDLVDLEANPEEKSLLASIFRTIHTIKGTCGFLGFTKLESIAHVGESLLSKLRDGELVMTQDITNSLLTMVDAVREILSNIDDNRSEGSIDYSDLVELMTYLQNGGNSESRVPTHEPVVPVTEPLSPIPSVEESEPQHEAGAGLGDMSLIIGEFLTESYENLDQLDQDLVDLEANPEEKSLLASIFRTIHTIKGTCGFLGFTKLESIAHVGENLLSKLRDGELDMTQDIANSLLTMVDAVREILSSIENSHSEGIIDYTDLVELMKHLQIRSDSEKSISVNETIVPVVEPLPPVFLDEEPKLQEASGSLFVRLGGQAVLDSAIDILYDKILADERIKGYFENIDTERLRNKQKAFMAFAFGGEAEYKGKSLEEAHRSLGLSGDHFQVMVEHFRGALNELNVAETVIDEAAKSILSTQDKIISEPLAVSVMPTPENTHVPEVEEVVQVPEQEAEEMGNRNKEDRRSGNREAEETFLASNEDRRSGGDRRSESIRVDVDLLDRLMNLVGELVLARNQIVQFTATEKDASIISTTQHLNQLTAELQEGVMKTRMQPIGNIWSKFPRVVRDLSQSCGKQVRLDMEGKDTELDKTLIEAIKDPLTHIVRNSVDHGIESPEKRTANGKNPEGRIFLRAYHEGGQVIIEVIDDGGGIDPEIIKRKAISKNLISPQDAARMSDREITNLIFSPGFSTAEKVSNISGRGVGMDVVKTNIEKIGGSVDIQSRVGEGTTLKVKIPLTLAIIPALLVTCGGLRYAIPQVNLVELVRLEAEDGVSAVEYIQDSPVYRLRGNLLPLVYLNKELGFESQADSASVNIVVLQADSRQFGLVVDDINNTEEIVVKPLGKQLKRINAYAGATIMGDGKVALILDAMGLAQKAHVLTEELRDRAHKETADKEIEQTVDRQTLLIFSPGNETRMAVPLSMVARLEEFSRDMVEISGEKEVVQYRGEIMPLINLSKVFGMSSMRSEDETMQVIVYSDQGRSVGVVVADIIDIVEEAVTIKKGSFGHGLLGSAVIQDKVTDMLDVEGVIRQADPEFYENQLSLASQD
jgi:two-component system chemotaxis sensor kinase CheA